MITRAMSRSVTRAIGSDIVRFQVRVANPIQGMRIEPLTKEPLKCIQNALSGDLASVDGQQLADALEALCDVILAWVEDVDGLCVDDGVVWRDMTDSQRVWLIQCYPLTFISLITSILGQDTGSDLGKSTSLPEQAGQPLAASAQRHSG